MTIRAFRYLHRPTVVLGKRVVHQLCITGAAGHVYAHPTLITGVASHSELSSFYKGDSSSTEHGATLTPRSVAVTSLLYSSLS